jgi:hypothetical protein
MPLKDGGGIKISCYKPETNAMAKTDSFEKELGAGIGGYGPGQVQGMLSEDLDALEIGVVLEVWDPVLMAILAGEM